MIEVKRYPARSVLGSDGYLVDAMHLDAALAREAALQAELGQCKSLLRQSQNAIDRDRELHKNRIMACTQRTAELEKAAKLMLRIAGIAKQGSSAYNQAFDNLHKVINPAE